MVTKQDQKSMESVDDFVKRASAWMEANLPSTKDASADDRALQRVMFDAGFAGIAYPVVYGGAGLTLEHHKAFYDLADDLGRQVRTKYRTSLATIGPTMLEHASHETNLRFLPPMMRGDQLWVQLLSEPQGGSDMAGAITRLTRDGDNYVLNGSKMWSSGAHEADWGIVLCRTNWDVPKHHGLSMIGLPLKDTPGLTLRQTRRVDGELGEFCEEYFDDIVLPKEYLIGDEDAGWSLARTLLVHERNYHGNTGYGYGRARYDSGQASDSAIETKFTPHELLAIAERRGMLPQLTSVIADTYIESVVGVLTQDRLNTGMRVGTHQGPWGSILKLRWAVDHQAARTELSVVGAEGVMWEGEDVEVDNTGTAWLSARIRTIAGGTNEMQRNTISERLLGLPRELPVDVDKPFRDVQGRKASR